MPDSLRQFKGHRKIVALTAYDAPMASILSEAEIDVLLVGDSLGMVVLGYENTHFVTMDDMIRHTGAVMRGNIGSLVVVDMPKASYDTPEMALENAQRLEKETDVRVLKIEGRPDIAKVLCEAGFAVMGHTGLKPQEVERMGLKGKTQEEADAIFEEAKALQSAGCFSLILESIPHDLAKKITDELTIPTIGIGAGPNCDGQILVLHDILGLYPNAPSFAKRYANVRESVYAAGKSFKDEVERGIFPSS